MRVFKTTYKDKSGKTREAAKWYVEFKDQLDTVRRLPAFKSKAASEEMGRNLERLVAYHRSTGGQVDPALTRWLAGLPIKACAKLVKIGLLAPDRVGVAKLLTDHLADFAKSLEAKDDTPFHVRTVTRRARRIIDGCGFRFHTDIVGGKVMAYLHNLRQPTARKRGISAQTFTFYVRAIKQFCKWLVKDRRATENPVEHLDGLNAKTDRRHDRRALSLEELVNLLKATFHGPERFGMAGNERALLYRLAVETGLRSGELRSLACQSFELASNPPTVTVQASYSKHRREDTLPLRTDLAADLEAFLAPLALATPVFRMPAAWEVIDMFREDLQAAGVIYRDDAGLVADFHCLRHTFITNLANGGVHPKTAQDLARHSDINLTMTRYSHTLLGQRSDALESLPDLSHGNQEKLKATGTADAKPERKNLASSLTFLDGFAKAREGADGRREEKSQINITAKKPGKIQDSLEILQYARRESNPQPMVPKTIALSS
jgi:integrase